MSGYDRVMAAILAVLALIACLVFFLGLAIRG